MRVNQTGTGRRDSSGDSQDRPLQDRPGWRRELLTGHAALAVAVKDASPGLIDKQVAPESGAGDSLASGAQAALPARPGSPGAGAAFSPAKGIRIKYAGVVDA
jgi:hypothetical protein